MHNKLYYEIVVYNGVKLSLKLNSNLVSPLFSEDISKYSYNVIVWDISHENTGVKNLNSTSKIICQLWSPDFFLWFQICMP